MSVRMTRLVLLLMGLAFFSLTAAAQPAAVTITDPAAAETVDVSGGTIDISGTSANLPVDGILRVRVRDATNATIGEREIAVAANWSTTVTLTGTPDDGSNGSIIVFGLRSNGGLEATSPVVQITFDTGTPPPTPATVAITSPAANAVVDIGSGPIAVSGTWAGDDAVQVLVRARDAGGASVGETTVSLDPGGTWSANITLTGSVTPGDTGSLIAFLQRSGGGLEATSAVVPIQYGNPVTTSITITSPVSGASINPDDPVTVSGTVTDPPGGYSIIVQARDNVDTLLGSFVTAADGSGNWTVTEYLTENLFVETPGTLQAFVVVGGIDNIIASSNVVNVTWLGSQQPTVTVASPADGTNVDVSGGTLAIAGTSTFLPAGAQIQVRARDASNNTLGEQTVTPDGSGNWSATLTLAGPIANGTSGSLIAFALDGGGGLLATSPVNTITYTDGSGGLTDVFITSPVQNQLVAVNQPLTVVGTVQNLPAGGSVLVQVENAGGAVIGEGRTTPDGSGNWSIALTLSGSFAPGQSGSVTARALDASDATLDVSPQVTFFFTDTTPPTDPSVIITSPFNGAIVPIGSAIVVQGRAENVFEGNVIVEARNANNDRLAQQPVTIDASGNWLANLFVNVPVGTPGSIVAYSISPVNGAVVASSRVTVFYGGPCRLRVDLPSIRVQRGDTLLRIAQRTNSTVQDLALFNCLTNTNVITTGQLLYVPQLPVTPVAPLPASVDIVAPADGAVLPVNAIITVNGISTGLNNGEILVRVQDTDGNLLAEETARPGIAGDWQVRFNVASPPGTPGTISAFGRAPNGVYLTDAVIRVTFGEPGTEPGDGPMLTFDDTTPDVPIFTGAPVALSGTASGLIDAEVFLRALDLQGTVLGEAPATLGNGATTTVWQANLRVDAPTGGRGLLMVYAVSAQDRRIVAAATRSVIFGQPNDAPFVIIEDPLPYLPLSLDEAIPVAGRLGNLSSANLVLRAIADDGDILAETQPTVNTDSTWTTEIDVNAANGTRGVLALIAVDPEDRSVRLAQASIPVVFGDPTADGAYVQVTEPLPGTVITQPGLLLLTGVGDAASTSPIIVQLLDGAGNVLVEQAATLVGPSGETGVVWQAQVQLAPEIAGVLQITAARRSEFDDNVIGADTVQFFFLPPDAPTTGADPESTPDPVPTEESTEPVG